MTISRQKCNDQFPFLIFFPLSHAMCQSIFIKAVMIHLKHYKEFQIVLWISLYNIGFGKFQINWSKGGILTIVN